MNLSCLPLNTYILSFNVKDFVLVKTGPIGREGDLGAIFPCERVKTCTPRVLSKDILTSVQKRTDSVRISHQIMSDTFSKV